MDTKNKLAKEAADQENKEELLSDDNKTQEQCCEAPGEEWWNLVCYPDCHVSER